MAMDYYLANRSRRFTQQIFTVCNTQQHPQLQVWPVSQVLERLRQRMGFCA